MEELKLFQEQLNTCRPAEWDSLPDLSLYMDQVLEYMSRQLISCGDGERLTAAMINNYMKDGLLPRAKGKRYSRTHLACLTAICALKQILPVRDAGLLVSPKANGSPQEMYDRFCRELDAALQAASGQLDTACPQEGLPQLALSFALRSYADRLVCQKLLSLMQERCTAPKGRKEKTHE